MFIDTTCNVSVRPHKSYEIDEWKIEEKYCKYTWVIHAPYTAGLKYSEIDFIRKYNPTFDWSESDCSYHAFDEKLPSGRWLENMSIDWKTNTITADVL